MNDRGVTRPMEMDTDPNDPHHVMKGKKKIPARFHRTVKLSVHHRKTYWVYWSLILLGIWLALSPLTVNYHGFSVVPPGGRSLWLDEVSRGTLFVFNDLLCGLLLIIFGWRSLTVNRPLSLWLACGIGVWLNFSPLLFWAPTPFIYMNETIVGMLVISLTILIPGMPNMINYMAMGADTPPGWSYNPSSWPQRSIMIALGFAGWLVSRYLAAYQLGFIDQIWDPFFGEGSRLVLTSNMSRSLPISDAGLGAFAYTFEFLMGWMGSSSRWRTMPWMVTLFGILVIPLGLVHIFLVMSQPVVVGAWCTFCLLAAAIMLPMIPLEVDEVIAMFQFLKQSKKNGSSLWKAFWMGGPSPEAEPDRRSPAVASFSEQPTAVVQSSLWGMSFPMTLFIAAGLGIIFMSLPAIIISDSIVANQFYIGGAVILTISILAMGEPIRILRMLNVPAGFWMMAVPWIGSSPSNILILSSLILGTLVIIASIPRGVIKENFGSWSK